MHEDHSRHRGFRSKGVAGDPKAGRRHPGIHRFPPARGGPRARRTPRGVADLPMDGAKDGSQSGSRGQGRRLRHPGRARSRRRALSFSLDVNVLLYASDASSPVHGAARRFLEGAAAGGDLLCLGWPTVMSYLRMATHPRIFASPLSPSDALGNVETLAGLPHVRLLAEEPGFLDVYRDVTSGFPVRGNLVPDAHLAALLKQHGVRTLFTRDTDFRKFDFLNLRDPFA